MKRYLRLIAAIALGAAAGAGATEAALAQPEESAALRATGAVGEQFDGYLGLVGSAPAEVRSRMDAVNIRRRAYYTELAQTRRATVEEAAAATACEIFARRVGPGQYYRLADGVWRQRNGDEPVPRPGYCR
jgi:hypothetical protein